MQVRRNLLRRTRRRSRITPTHARAIVPAGARQLRGASENRLPKKSWDLLAALVHDRGRAAARTIDVQRSRANDDSATDDREPPRLAPFSDALRRGCDTRQSGKGDERRETQPIHSSPGVVG